MPEYAAENPADQVLHDQTSFWLKVQLFGEPGVILTDVPYRTEGRKLAPHVRGDSLE
jgi:hypothetical protein